MSENLAAIHKLATILHQRESEGKARCGPNSRGCRMRHRMDATSILSEITNALQEEEEDHRMTILDKAPQIDAPIVLREQMEADGSVSRVEAWLIGDGDESKEQIVVTETPIPLTWGGTLWHGYNKHGELVRLLVNNHDPT